MDLLVDIEAYFQSLGILGSYVCSFDGARDKPDAQVVISEYPGALPPMAVEGAQRSIQIAVRNIPDLVVDARMKANALYRSFRTSDDAIIHLTPERWGVVELKQLPFKMRVDSQGRVYYGFNLSIVTYND